jgi:hypothetical protein
VAFVPRPDRPDYSLILGRPAGLGRPSSPEQKEARMSEESGSVEISFVDGKDVPIKHKHADRMVVMRDSSKPDGDALYYTPNEWEAFILGVKDGEFDDMVEEPRQTS